MVRYFDSGEPFPLEQGGELPALRIAYHTYGEPNAARDNVVWVCHALTANSDVADWWPHTVEEGGFSILRGGSSSVPTSSARTTARQDRCTRTPRRGGRGTGIFPA